jgi:type II secretory pathway component GspD/PulD (secretin)
VPFSSTSGTNNRWEQIDVGVNIDCRQLEVMDNRASLDIKAEISSVMEPSKADSAPFTSLPIIRQNQWESRVVIPVKQQSVLFSSDDPASKRIMRVELTVTPLR